jgi:hypothetical protein
VHTRRLTAHDYEDEITRDLRVASLRAKMEVREKPTFTPHVFVGLILWAGQSCVAEDIPRINQMEQHDERQRCSGSECRPIPDRDFRGVSVGD